MSLKARLDRLAKANPPTGGPAVPGVFWALLSTPPADFPALVESMTPADRAAVEKLIGPALAADVDGPDDYEAWATLTPEATR